jgi:hypothetical protein
LIPGEQTLFFWYCSDYESLIGYSITLGAIELATRHPVSGTTRMFMAIIDALQLGFGLTIGSAAAVRVRVDCVC